MTPAIELEHVSKIYRRYGGRRFSTLKSALLQRSIVRDLRPSDTFPALSFCSCPNVNPSRDINTSPTITTGRISVAWSKIV